MTTDTTTTHTACFACGNTNTAAVNAALLDALKAIQPLFSDIADWQEASQPLATNGKRVVRRALALKNKVDAAIARATGGEG